MKWQRVFTWRSAATVLLINAAMALVTGCGKSGHRKATALRWFWVDEIPARHGSPGRKPADWSQVFVVVEFPRELLGQAADLRLGAFKLHGSNESVSVALEQQYVTTALGTDNQKEWIRLVIPAKRIDAESGSLELQIREQPRLRLDRSSRDDDFEREWLRR